MQFYECITANYSINWGIENGFCVPPVCKLTQLHHLDLSKVAIVGGDYKQTDLQKQLHKEQNLHRLCLITKEHMEGPTVVFTASVFQAEGVAHYLRESYGIKAAHVFGKQDPEERADVLRDFKNRDIDVLVNCQVVACGFDDPGVRTLILGRVTRSRSFWLQCIGRATRPLPGTIDVPGISKEERLERIRLSAKPNFKIIDCTDSSMDHKLIVAPDMFCSLSESERAVAREICRESSKPLTPEEIAEKAREEAEKRANAEAIAEMRRNTKGEASGTITTVTHELGSDGKRSVGTYKNPLRGKYAGRKLSELPSYYLSWGAGNQKLTGWIRNLYRKEIKRRHEKLNPR